MAYLWNQSPVQRVNIYLWRLTACGISLVGFCVNAAESDKKEPFVSWYSSNVQFLRGWDYQVGDPHRSLFTFEHANSWKYGDFFSFTDLGFADSSAIDAYTELSPRLSISKISGQSLAWGPVHDVLVSTTYEWGERGIRRYLVGGAVDWKVPGFAFLKTNFYLRDDPNLPSQTWQSTVVWKYPFKLGRTSWVTEGFADFAGSEGRSAANQLIVPRLLMDVGSLLGGRKNQVWAGVEYQYWHNKFGIKGVTESVPQLQLKWVF